VWSTTFFSFSPWQTKIAKLLDLSTSLKWSHLPFCFSLSYRL
jgi:hypothetical protein